MVVGSITTYAITVYFHESSNPVRGVVYSRQHYVIKCASNLRQLSSFLPVLRFRPPIKLTTKLINPSYASEEISHKLQTWILRFYLKRSIRFSCQIIMLKYPTCSYYVLYSIKKNPFYPNKKTRLTLPQIGK